MKNVSFASSIGNLTYGVLCTRSYVLHVVKGVNKFSVIQIKPLSYEIIPKLLKRDINMLVLWHFLSYKILLMIINLLL